MQGREVHDGPKNGSDFARTVPNPHGENQNQALHHISLVSEVISFSRKSYDDRCFTDYEALKHFRDGTK